MSGGADRLADLLRALPLPPEQWMLSARQIFEPDDVLGQQETADNLEDVELHAEETLCSGSDWDELEPGLAEPGGEPDPPSW